MNQLITATQLTMSSREIADLTKKEHKNVKRTIEALISDSILTAQVEPLSYEHRGNWYRFYELNKRDSLVVVARLSPEFTAAIVDRWQELESQQAPKLPQSFSQALQLAANQAKVIEDQQAAIALAAPKVEFVDRYVASTGNKGFRQVAKLLKAEQWTVYSNTLPLCKLTDEQYGKMRRMHDDGAVVEFANVTNEFKFEVIEKPNWCKDQVYRIKPKSERELFITRGMDARKDHSELTAEQMSFAAAILFDSGARYTDKTQFFGESI